MLLSSCNFEARLSQCTSHARISMRLQWQEVWQGMAPHRCRRMDSSKEHSDARCQKDPSFLLLPVHSRYFNRSLCVLSWVCHLQKARPGLGSQLAKSDAAMALLNGFSREAGCTIRRSQCPVRLGHLAPHCLRNTRMATPMCLGCIKAYCLDL